MEATSSRKIDTPQDFEQVHQEQHIKTQKVNDLSISLFQAISNNQDIIFGGAAIAATVIIPILGGFKSLLFCLPFIASMGFQACHLYGERQHKQKIAETIEKNSKWNEALTIQYNVLIYLKIEKKIEEAKTFDDLIKVLDELLAMVNQTLITTKEYKLHQDFKSYKKNILSLKDSIVSLNESEQNESSFNIYKRCMLVNYVHYETNLDGQIRFTNFQTNRV